MSGVCQWSRGDEGQTNLGEPDQMGKDEDERHADGEDVEDRHGKE